MACKTETEIINGHTYVCTQLDAERALKAQLKLMRIMGEPIIELLSKMEKNGLDDEAAMSSFSKLGKNLDSDEFFKMFVDFTSECMRDGQRVNFVSDFSGNLLESWKVFIFVLKVNFKDFFSGVRSLTKGMGAIPNEAEKSQKK